MQETIQNVASGKAALTTAVSVGAMPWWLQFIHSPLFQTIVIFLGMLVSVSIIAINVQTFIIRRKENNDKE